MGICFWAPDAPTFETRPYPEDEPDYVEMCSELPEISLSNTNAYVMLRALGVTPYYVGKWSVEELPDLLDRAMKLANIEGLRMPYTSETVVSGGECRAGDVEGNVTSLTRGCTVTSYGRTDEYVQRTAMRFVELFRRAKERSFSVSWC